MSLGGALLLLLLKRHWFAYVLLAGALFLLGHGLFMLKAFEAAPATAATQPAFRLISFNIENFNFKNGRPIADAVIASGADVVNILEAEPLIPEIARLTQAYPYRIGCGVETDGCDTLVLSKRPFVETSLSSIGDLWPNHLVTVCHRCRRHQDHLRLGHLAKPYFGDFQVNELVDLRGVIAAIEGPLVLAEISARRSSIRTSSVSLPPLASALSFPNRRPGLSRPGPSASLSITYSPVRPFG